MMITAELAVRCCRTNQLRLPANLAQLVPEYLKRVPIDPFSGKPIIYRLEESNWLLYSVGQDGVDDGGVPAGGSVPGTVTKGDLYYNSPY